MQLLLFQMQIAPIIFLSIWKKVDNDEFGVPKDLMTIVYAVKTTRKIIGVPIRKDKHVSPGVGQYIIPSIIGATKTIGPRTFRSYMESSMEIYMKYLTINNKWSI
jgi:hypothetical protein